MTATSVDAMPTPPPARGRNPWLGALLSLLTPGLGQLYAGRWQRGTLFFLTALTIDASYATGIWSFTDVLLRADGFWLSCAIVATVLSIRIAAIFDAAIVAYRASTKILFRYQRWYVYLALLFVWYAPSLLGFWNADSGIRSYSIPSSSMAPALQVGDFVIGITIAGDELPPPGAIVTWTDGPSGGTYVQRLIGLPRDTVEIRDGVLLLNGETIVTRRAGSYRDPAGRAYEIFEEALPGGTVYRVLDAGAGSMLDTLHATTVPPGHVFLLGDNRDNSRDSRIVGPVPAATLEAMILYIYWSTDLDRIGNRTN